jgi:hypothetical protein
MNILTVALLFVDAVILGYVLPQIAGTACAHWFGFKSIRLRC